jgi:hypothetical protein
MEVKENNMSPRDPSLPPLPKKRDPSLPPIPKKPTRHPSLPPLPTKPPGKSKPHPSLPPKGKKPKRHPSLPPKSKKKPRPAPFNRPIVGKGSPKPSRTVKKSSGKVPGIVTGALARKKAGLKYKLSEGYDTAAQAHVKEKAKKR